MTIKRLFLVLAAGALLLLQFNQCLFAMAPNQQSMKCCASMPCTPANQSQGCCKNMISVKTPRMLPTQHLSLHAPIAATIEYPRMLDIVRWIPAPYVMIEAQQHSPPELYTLHASLLI